MAAIPETIIEEQSKQYMPKWGFAPELLGAIQCKDVAECSVLLSLGADVDEEFKMGTVTRPAIAFAVEGGSLEIVRILVRFGCAINRQDSNGKTPLHIAIQMGYDQIADFLLKNRASVSAIDRHGNTPLHLAALKGNLNLVRLLVSYGADIHRTGQHGQSAFLCACSVVGGNTSELIEFLIEQGADIHQHSSVTVDGLLSVVNQFGYDYRTVKLLIEHGAKPDLVCGRYAPIHLVAENTTHPMKWDTLDLMLKAGCPVDTLSNDMQTPLMLAVRNNDLKSVRILLRANADPNVRDLLGNSPLSLAILTSNGMNEMIEVLLGAGARMSIESFERIKLPPPRQLTPKDIDSIRSRLVNPMKLTQIARKGLCQRFGPHTYDWLCRHGEAEIPKTLIAFVKYNSEEY